MPLENTRDSDGVPPAETTQASSSSAVRTPTLQQGDGSKVPADENGKPNDVRQADPNVHVVELPPRSPTFKEQVYGYARLIRGTVLGQPEVKEQGAQVLRGEQSVPLRQGSSSDT